MTRKTVLFLGPGDDRGPAAARAFNAVAERMRLPWAAEARPLTADSPTTADLYTPSRVVLVNEPEQLPLFRERFPEQAEAVEGWHVPAGKDVAAVIDREVSDLVARLLGGGRKRTPGPLPAPEPPRPKPEPPRKTHTVKVSRETAGRRGKGVTVVSELPLNEAGLQTLATELKQKCGTGGTAKGGRIEIQGDHRDRLVTELERLGYKVKRAGG